MTLSVSSTPKIVVRPLQYRDLELIKALLVEYRETEMVRYSLAPEQEFKKTTSWYGLGKLLRFLPYPYQPSARVYVAEQQQQILGLIQVSPFNSSRSTWRVERVLLNPNIIQIESLTTRKEIGSQLLRYCLENIWEARTWILEVNVNDKDNLALYRENGFQPLAQMTYWAIAPELLDKLATQEPDLPNLLPVSNADAQLLYQLDCVSIPPLLRQVFDRHIQDFKSSLWQTALAKLKSWWERSEVTKGYVFEPQRKAAIGYFQLYLDRYASRPYRAKLIVHPAYTWLYPKLMAQMAQIWQKLPSQSLELVSADYQPEREEYLNKLGAEQVEHTLVMSRSVWHKLKETKPLEGLQLPEVFQGLKPVRTPVPSRFSWLKLAVPQLFKGGLRLQKTPQGKLLNPKKEERDRNCNGNLNRQHGQLECQNQMATPCPPLVNSSHKAVVLRSIEARIQLSSLKDLFTKHFVHEAKVSSESVHYRIEEQDVLKANKDSSSEENNSIDSSNPPSNGHHA